MQPNETVRKQTTLGGAAGIALLAFALVYRFFPGWLHVAPPVRTQGPVATTRSAGPAPPPIGVHPPPADVTPTDIKPPDAAEMGPPRALAGAAATAPEKVEPSVPDKPPSANTSALLAKADQAQAEGHLVGEADSALELYNQVLAEDATNRRALAGLAAVRTMLVGQAQAALEQGSVDDAETALAALAKVPHEKADLDPLVERLKVLKQTAPLLARAAVLLKENKATTPAGASALDVYRRVRELDPANALAAAGLEQIQRVYLDQALGAVAQDDFAAADKLLAQAGEIYAGSQSLQDTRSRVEGLRRQRAESVLEQARSALDGGDSELAQQLQRRALAISPDLPGIEEFNERLRNARLYANFKPGEVITDPFVDRSGRAPPLVVIPTGSFLMGSPETEEGHRSTEEPQREVIINSGFALAQTEVTIAQFREFVRAAGYQTEAEREGVSSVYDENAGRMSDQRGASWADDYRGKRGRDTDPVVHVAFADAQAYADWLAARTGKPYRLPSEAEFEYALRAGHATRYWWGDGDPPRVLANVTGMGDRSPSHRTWAKGFARYNDGYWGPAPVKSFAPNPFGLYDMDGNVSEWVADCWHDNYIRAPRDSSAWVNAGCDRHVVRGGSWGSDPDQVRSAFRLSALNSTHGGRVGFRVARNL